MRFNIYLRRFGKLLKLYRFHRSTGGIYWWSSQSPSDYVSYHNDGKYWIRSNGQKTVKKLRQPLSGFKGEETLSLSVNMFHAPRPHDKDEGLVRVLPDDIVLELDGTFVVEIILSADRLSLPAHPDRPNSVVHVRDSAPPVITVEAFTMVGNLIPVERFRSSMEWVEGENVFFGDLGRI